MPHTLIRCMDAGDLDFAASLVAAEGWAGETREVFADFLAHFPPGCRLAESNGRSVGICVSTPYERCGFIGELVVCPEYRGRGIGGRLFRDALDVLTRHGIRTVYLDGDPPAVPIYAAAGFQRLYRSLRFKGMPAARPSCMVKPISHRALKRVLETDVNLFGQDRGFFLFRKWQTCPDLCLMTMRDNAVSGYVFGYPGNGVISVGPMAADSENTLRSLLGTLAANARDLPLRLGVLEINETAAAWLRHLPGIKEEDFSWRMVRGRPTGLGESPNLIAIGSAASG